MSNVIRHLRPGLTRTTPHLQLALLPTITSQRLRELGPLADRGPLPVEDVDGGGDDDGDAAEEGGGPFQVEGCAHVFVHWYRQQVLASLLLGG